MSDVLAQLTPRSVWSHFAELCRIPRPSGHEAAVANWVAEVAGQHGFKVDRDAVGNLVIDVPATPGHGNAPLVILQGHLDMVGEKNKDVAHEFTRDPIRPRVDGDWVTATGTTLGADNGIGVAAALAAATDPSVTHGPLQLLFTLDEETGLTGAKGLDGSLLRGRTLLNLDSEEDGVLFVGCSGGTDTLVDFPVERSAADSGSSWVQVEVTGLKGGHSGLNIHENRGNAIKILAHTVLAAAEAGLPVRLASIRGGSKHNAIPREADAVLALPATAIGTLEGLVAQHMESLRDELHGIDDGIRIEARTASAAPSALAVTDTERLLRLLVSLPHGVLGMSPAIPGLVETSSNLAVVQERDGGVRVVTSTRSSVASILRSVLAGIRAAGYLAGARVQTRDGYPGWKPNLASPALKVVREVYARHWGREPKITAIHAGLECGLLGEKVPGLDMVSIGPQIEGAHSPDERVNVPSVERFWAALKDVLLAMA